jgi:type IV pilus assembly protein PilQ
MRVKRLLTVALMALFCAGTATAASQLNSLQVTSSQNAAAINLLTTGSFAHKEYRPDDHLVLVDLTGVTPDANVPRAATLNSSVLKSFKLSSYTSASGSDVTRIELVIGDGVGLVVADKSDGLQILLSTTASNATAVQAPAPPSAGSPIPASPDKSTNPLPAYAQPVAKSPSTPPAAPAVTQPASSRSAPSVASQPAPSKPAASVANQATTSITPKVAPATSAIPTVISSVSAHRGNGAVDVVVEGPNAAQLFVLTHPDRLVLDFNNAVVRSSVKNFAVQSNDVLHVRVGRFQAAPPITRIVVDLAGPRSYEVLNSVGRVTLRIKSEVAAVQPLPVKPLPAPIVASVTPASTPASATGSTPASATGSAKPPATFETPYKLSVDASAKPQPIAASPASAPAVVSAPAPVSTPSTVAATPSSMTPVTPAEKPSYKLSANAPFKSQPPVESPAPSTAAPTSPVQSVHESVSSTSAQSLPQESSISRSDAHDRDLSDPAVRAGQAAGTMASSPQKDQRIQIAQLVSPGELPGGSRAPKAPKYTGEPISVNLKDVDLKDFFRLIHEISGLNIVLDPSVHGSVTLVLDDVPWDQALDIVLKNNSLDRELQGNVLRIAATDTLRKEAVDSRAQSEAVALAVDRQTITRFLSYAKSRDVVPTVKKFLTARGDVISDERTNALIISDIPSVIPNLDRLISQLDRKSQEVEIEVRVVSASRSFSRDLGVQLGFNWGNGTTTIGGSNPNGTTSTTTGTTTTTTNTVPLFTSFSAPGATSGISLSSITSSYGIDAVLTAAETHSLAKVLSRPRIVTQSNVKAEVKQGLKIPVYTSGTGNSNSSVSYVDAVLRLSVTPQITADNTIFLTVDVENTQVTGSPLANGNFELSTQQATTQVLVTDGGTVVIGGVIQTTNSVSTSQTPVLGSIPWLGNLFKQRSVSTETDELIFFITPKIIQT